MQLKFIGRDSGFGENNNSAYYETEDKLVLIDCGFTVFNIVKHKFDFSKYKKIEIIITHLHSDHAGSLSQLILYLWFIYHKKTCVISKCERIREYLEITGTRSESYELYTSRDNLEFIKTKHVSNLDSYGFKTVVNGRNIIYTSDTSSLDEFENYLPEVNELYVDVSVNGGVHLKIDDILPKLNNLKSQGVEIYLMHLDDKEKINLISNNNFYVD